VFNEPQALRHALPSYASVFLVFAAPPSMAGALGFTNSLKIQHIWHVHTLIPSQRTHISLPCAPMFTPPCFALIWVHTSQLCAHVL